MVGHPYPLTEDGQAPEQMAPEQMAWEFEGIPVQGCRFSLVSATGHLAPHPLEPEMEVRFSGVGRVRKVAYARVGRHASGQPIWARVHEIEVIEAEIA